MFKFGNIARQKFVASPLVDTQLSATTLIIKGDIDKGPGADTSNYGAVLEHFNEVGVTFHNPYGKNFSYFFDGAISSTYAQVQYVANTNCFLGAGNWTVEFFFRYEKYDLESGYTRTFISQTNDTNSGFQVVANDYAHVVGNATCPAGGIIFRTDVDIIGTTTSLADYQWHHIAFSKVNSIIGCYVDGQLQSSTIFSYNLNNASNDYIMIGRRNNVGAGALEGWISNIRLCNGSGLYSGPSFAVPTSPLTTVTNCTVLWLTNAQSGTVEQSMWQRPLTQSGDPLWLRPIGPFVNLDGPDSSQAISLGYSHTRSGYSVTQADGRYRVGPNDFIVEFWVYMSSEYSNSGGDRDRIISVGDFVIDWYKRSNYDGFGLSSDYSASAATSQVRAATTWRKYHHWHHICIARQGTSIGIWINGVLRAYQVDSSNFGGSQWLAIGGPSQNYQSQTNYGDSVSRLSQNGSFLISDLRIVVGTALNVTTSTVINGVTTGNIYITVPSSPINTNTNWRGLTTSSLIMFAGFDRQYVKHNRMPLNTGWGGMGCITASTNTNLSPSATLSGSGPYDWGDYGGMSSFTPFGTHGWSAYFTATNTLAQYDWFTVPIGKMGGVNTSTGIAMDLIQSNGPGAGAWYPGYRGYDFTAECWFNVNVVTATNCLMTLNYQSNYANLYVGTTGTQMFLYMASNSTVWSISTTTLGSTGTIVAGTWYHMAVTKSSGTVRLYLNGNDLTAPYFNANTGQVGGLAYTGTGVTAYTANYIGYNPGPPLSQGGIMNGYISALRVVQGQSIYTGNFVPSIKGPARLTQDQGYNQSRLFYPGPQTGSSLFFSAAAATNFVNFNSSTSALMAWPTRETQTNTSTWSTLTQTINWYNINLSTTATSDWTVECWVYPENFGAVGGARDSGFMVLGTTATTTPFLAIKTKYAANTGTLKIAMNPTSSVASAMGWSADGWTAPITTASQILPFVWTHLAVTRQNGIVYGYVNGQQVLAITTGSGYDLQQHPVRSVGIGYTGSTGDEPYSGSVSNVRITQGQAIYRGTFTAVPAVFTTATIGMSGANIASTLTGLVVFLGAQDNYGGQRIFTGDTTKRTVAIINSGTLVNGTTTTAFYSITTTTGNVAVFPRLFGPLGATPSLLTFTSRTWEDISLNTNTIQKNLLSGVRLTPFAPYKTPTSYNPAVNGGSYYFSNAVSGGNRLALYSVGSSVLQFMQRDFTIDIWFYIDVPVTEVRFLLDTGGNNNGCRISIGAAGQLHLKNQGDTILLDSTTISASNLVHSGAWYHAAWTRRSGVSQGWLNGKSFGTFTDTTSYYDYRSQREGPVIGHETGFGANGFRGYVASTRITHNWALYTQEFSPPNSIFTRTTDTYFLYNFENARIYDPSQKNSISFMGDVRVLPDVSPYATSWSYKFDGRYGDAWYAANNTDFVPVRNSGLSLMFGSGDYTFETWLKIYELMGRGFGTADDKHMLIDYQTDQDNTAWASNQGHLGNYFKVMIQNSGTIATAVGNSSNSVPNWVSWGPTNTATTHAITVSSWTHVAVVREAGIQKIFINGYVVREAEDRFNYTTTGTYSTRGYMNRPAIGTWGRTSTGDYGFDGYMSNMRIVKGLAVYSTSSASTAVQQFIPSLVPLTTSTNSGTNIRAVRGLGQYGQSVYFTSATSISYTNYINTPTGSGFDLVNNTFTIEGWAQYQINTATQQTIFSLGKDASNKITLYTSSTYTLNVTAVVGGVRTLNFAGPSIINTFTQAVLIGTGTNIFSYTSSTNRWFHWAVTKDAAGTAGNVRLYVNGIMYGTPTQSTSWFADGGNYMSFGYDPLGGSTSTHGLWGYLSNVRVIKNQALYTATIYNSPTFYPPTNGFVGSLVGSTGTYITNTLITGTVSLLTFNTTTLTDLSGNGVALTVTGVPAVDPTFGPFGYGPALMTFNQRDLADSSLNSATITLINVGTTNNKPAPQITAASDSGGTPKPSLEQPFAGFNSALQLPNRSMFLTGGSWSNVGVMTRDWAYIKVPDSPHIRFGRGPFTIECWFLYAEEWSNQWKCLMSKGGSNYVLTGNGNVTRGWAIYLADNNKITWFNDDKYLKTTTTPMPDQWNHLVIQRENTSTSGLKIFMNGVLEAAGDGSLDLNTSTNATSIYQTPMPLLVGMDASTNFNYGYQWVGYVDDIRLTTGIARYANTTTVTVPTAYVNER
jgi:hypothetical protein